MSSQLTLGRNFRLLLAEVRLQDKNKTNRLKLAEQRYITDFYNFQSN